MNSIMVDNWFMEEVIADIKEQKTHRSRCYGELLMAIVLWDEVYYPKNNYNWWNSIPSQVQNALIPLDDCVLQALELSDTVYFIITPEISTLKNAKNCMNVLNTLELSKKVEKKCGLWC